MFGRAQWRPAVAVRLLATPPLRIFPRSRFVTAAERNCRGMSADFCVPDRCQVSSENIAILCLRLRLLWCFPAAEAFPRKLLLIAQQSPPIPLLGLARSPV